MDLLPATRWARAIGNETADSLTSRASITVMLKLVKAEINREINREINEVLLRKDTLVEEKGTS